MEPTEIEKVNLEAHVDMCFSRHEGLAIRLEKIETSMEDLEDLIADKTQCIYNGMLGVGGSIIATLIGVIITIYNK